MPRPTPVGIPHQFQVGQTSKTVLSSSTSQTASPVPFSTVPGIEPRDHGGQHRIRSADLRLADFGVVGDLFTASHSCRGDSRSAEAEVSTPASRIKTAGPNRSAVRPTYQCNPGTMVWVTFPGTEPHFGHVASLGSRSHDAATPEAAAAMSDPPIWAILSLHASSRAARRRLEEARESLAGEIRGGARRCHLHTPVAQRPTMLYLTGIFRARRAETQRRLVVVSRSSTMPSSIPPRRCAADAEVARLPVSPDRFVPVEALQELVAVRGDDRRHLRDGGEQRTGAATAAGGGRTRRRRCRTTASHRRRPGRWAELGSDNRG